MSLYKLAKFYTLFANKLFHKISALITIRLFVILSVTQYIKYGEFCQYPEFA